MEDQIFKRLQMIYPVTTMDNSKCAAKEIDTLTRSHYMEFIEWSILNLGKDFYITGDEIYLRKTRYNKRPKKYTIEKLYQYWQNNKL